jgi:glycosyltransferase involved in cell wall biosynthesis
MVANPGAPVAERIRLTHVWSHDVGIAASMPYVQPLLARGWELSFLCPPGENAALAERQGMRAFPLAMRRDFHPPSDLVGAAQMVRRFRRDRPHIVHTHAFKTGHAARVLAYASRVPIVIHTVHGQPYSLETPALKRRLLAAIEWLVSVRVDAILVQGEEDRQTLVETGAVRPELITWIGNGIDLSRFRPGAAAERDRAETRAELGLAPDEILFLSAGRLVREKGFVELFEAAARARREDRRIRLAVAGDIDTGKADALDRSVVEAARSAGVLMLGRRGDMPRLYAASDVVALASWREGLPRVLMEGAAMGKPLLASDVRGCREVVKPPRNGLLAAVGDAAALTRAMLELAADPDRRTAWGEANALEARERYDLSVVVPRVIGVYDRLLREKGLA